MTEAGAGWLMGLTALGGYVFVYFPILEGAGTLVRSSSLPPSVFAWTPIFLLATVLMRRLAPEPAR